MSKLLIVFLVFIFLFRCSQLEKKSQTRPLDKLTIEEDSLAKTTSNQEYSESVVTSTIKQTNRVVSVSNIFARTTYLLTSDYDLDNCEDLSRCDCCTSEVAFLDARRYVYMFVCEASTIFLKGVYQLDSNRLTLQHDSIIVNDEQPMFDEELEGGVDTTQFGVFVSKKIIKPLEFEITVCNDRTLIQTVGNSNTDYGTKASRASLLRLILSDDSSEVVKKLGIE